MTPLAPVESIWLHRVMLGSSLSNSLNPIDLIAAGSEEVQAAEMTLRQHMSCTQIEGAWKRFDRQLSNGVTRCVLQSFQW